ncbi:MAG TPA: 30S ribosomal protein S27ae [Nanoarchaeota archaeon]|nr:30S ribosomal protein S27ae [Nanoarchaeota archaeon]
MADAKKAVKKSNSIKKYKKYTVSGENLTRLGKTCPKCGPAVFMAEHKDRSHCGKCGYAEFKKAL